MCSCQHADTPLLLYHSLTVYTQEPQSECKVKSYMVCVYAVYALLFARSAVACVCTPGCDYS